MVRLGASEFQAAGLHFGHGTDNAFDEALALALYALHLDHSVQPEVLDARLTEGEIGTIYDFFRRRIETRKPAAYLTRETWFAGLRFYVDERVLVPRSPIAELIERGFEPWFDSATAQPRVLDLCCGSGCIGIACAVALPAARVDLADIDSGALAVARRNVADYALGERVAVIESDLFAGLAGRRYDLVVCNPPYVDAATYAALPPEYGHEPRAGLESGSEGLDHALKILAQAPAHLNPAGVLVLEVGASRAALERRLPRLEITWADLERGGEGVAVIAREALAATGRAA